MKNVRRKQEDVGNKEGKGKIPSEGKVRLNEKQQRWRSTCGWSGNRIYTRVAKPERSNIIATCKILIR